VRAAERAGAPGRIRFTRRQLYYELCRGLRPVQRLPRRLRVTPRPAVGYERFLAALDAHGPVPGLLTGDRPAPVAALHDDVPDLYDYGLPRLLVCQDPEIAGMLLANELHMESACPVFALRDLPLDPRLTAALQRTPDAVVHVLHDASTAGYAAVADVVRWAGDVRVHPLGLRPVHATALHLCTTAAARSAVFAGGGLPALAGGLEPWELRWLGAGRAVEVAAVGPARLLRTVHRLVRGVTRNRRRPALRRQIRAAGFMTWPAA